MAIPLRSVLTRSSITSSSSTALRIHIRQNSTKIHPRPLGAYYELIMTSHLNPTSHPFSRTSSNPDSPPVMTQSPASTSSTPPPSPSPKPALAQAVGFIPASSPDTPIIEGEREVREIFNKDVRRPTPSKEQGETIAGMWVPPKPVEPDNCCMSGCVNCVMTQFMEELDEWKAAKKQAEAALKALQKEKIEAEGETSVDEDGGSAPGLWEGYDDIPVGMRVFMETERKLKEAGKTV